ncbi:hypothetical protein CICLE_v10003549mg [Citrus x clementina]|uniref:Uncharacterized protein n=1 Tax=Citrus clementina TaxID=85681 RepID=V4T5M6_CITCL|nr:hypothetical protein CICLE_v10003549mg [Citrus x clementina]
MVHFLLFGIVAQQQLVCEKPHCWFQRQRRTSNLCCKCGTGLSIYLLMPPRRSQLYLHSFTHFVPFVLLLVFILNHIPTRLD